MKTVMKTLQLGTKTMVRIMLAVREIYADI